MQVKYCPCCKDIKPVSEFSTMKVRGGVASHCRSCAREMQKKYNASPEGKQARKARYERNKKVLKNSKLLRDFGISLDQYEARLKEQSGGCAICGKTPEANGKMLAVDHNHVTGANRGILCSSCNICIGFIEKNQLNFDQISQYLKKHGVTHYGVHAHSKSL